MWTVSYVGILQAKDASGDLRSVGTGTGQRR